MALSHKKDGRQSLLTIGVLEGDCLALQRWDLDG